jgi:cytochrome c-type biogenesis protein CcmH
MPAIRLRRKICLLILLLLFMPFAAEADEALSNPSEEARALALGAELRCVVCQSESINDSEADMAHDMRVLVREKIHEGWMDQQIKDFMRHRYGDFILLQPPVQSNTYLLWALPALFILIATGSALLMFSGKRRIKKDSIGRQR